MADVTLNLPVGAGAHRRPRPFRRLQALLRHWRRNSNRRRLLAQLRAETSDPRIFEDVGFPPPARHRLEVLAFAALYHDR